MSDVQEKLSPDYQLFLKGDTQTLWKKYRNLFLHWMQPVKHTCEPEDLVSEAYLFYLHRYHQIDIAKILHPDTWELKAAMYLPFKSLNKRLGCAWNRGPAHERLGYDELSRAKDDDSKGVIHQCSTSAYSPETLFFSNITEDLVGQRVGSLEIRTFNMRRQGYSNVETSQKLSTSLRQVREINDSIRQTLCEELGIDYDRELDVMTRQRALAKTAKQAYRKSAKLKKVRVISVSSPDWQNEREQESSRWAELGSMVHA